MQAIQTRILPATNHKPTRIKAWCSRGSVIISDPDLDQTIDRHREAARRLIARFVAEDLKQYGSPIESNSWNQPFLTGSIPNGDFVHTWPHVGSTAVLIECANESDRDYLQRYVEACRKSDGTVTGCLHGCACSALKQAKETVI